MRRAPMAAAVALGLLAGCVLGDAGSVDGGPPDATPVDAAPPECTTPGRTLDDDCVADADCDDGCACNGVERCLEGSCAGGLSPCDDGVDCTEDRCDEERGTCFNEPLDGACDDGDACNGAERCVPRTGCVAGDAPICEDGDPCTVDGCDPASGCTRAILDEDGDGYAPLRCGGLDCDDDPSTGGAINPAASERCANGLDDDCDGVVDHADPRCAATADTCGSDASALPGPGSFLRSTEGLADDLSLACAGGELVDAVYRLELPDARDVRLRVVEAAPGAALALRPLGLCAEGPDVACDAPEGDPPELVLRDVPAGSYAVVVETSEPEPFRLDVALEAPSALDAGDRCDSTAPDVSAGGTFAGSFGSLTDLYRLSCADIGGEAEAAFSLTVPPGARRDVSLEASLPGTTGRNAAVALVRDCAAWWDDASTVACALGTPARVEARDLPEGRYWVLLEPSFGGATDWNLSVDVAPSAGPEPADTCATALDVTDTTVAVPLAPLLRDGDNRCDPDADVPGTRDAFFFFELSSPSDVTLTTDAGAVHQVSVSTTACGDPGPGTECLGGVPTVTRSWAGLPAGIYWIAVTTAATAGDLVVSTVVTP